MRYLAFMLIGFPMGAVLSVGAIHLWDGDKIGWFHIVCGLCGFVGVGLASWVMR